MESEGTSRDDLDVRLHWPGAEPEEAAGLLHADSKDGAPAEESSAPGQPEPAVTAETEGALATETGAPATPEIAWDALQDTLRSISERIDRLASRFEASQRALEVQGNLTAIIAAVEGLERSLAIRQSDDSLRLEEITHQIEALRRRMTLKARGDYSLSPDAIQLIADAVVERLSGSSAPARLASWPRSGRDARRK